MEKDSKWDSDFDFGKARRDITLDFLNSVLNPNGISIRLIHQELREMTAAEKKENNTLVNRLLEFKDSPEPTSMGLDCLVTGGIMGAAVVAIRYFDCRTIYYKCPSDFKLWWKEFTERHLSQMYFLFLNWPFHSHYCLIRGNAFQWSMNTSRGNRNRLEMVFGGKTIDPAKKLPFTPIDGEEFGLGIVPPYPSLVKALKGILK